MQEVEATYTGQATTRPVVEAPPSSYPRVLAIKLYTCPNEWLKIGVHPCWKVQKALDDQSIDYELVKGPLRSSKREKAERLSGQRKYPIIEFEDGRVYREESKDMAERIRAGKLFAGAEGAEPTA